MDVASKIKTHLACFLLLNFLLSASTLPGSFSCDPQDEPKSRLESWREDIDFFAGELPKKHINLFFRLPEPDFKRMIQELKGALAGLSDQEIIWGLSRIIASVGDEHTTLRYNPGNAFPITLFWFKEGIHAINSIPGYEQILNCRLVQVDSLPLDKVVEDLKHGISHGNMSQLKSTAPYYLVIPDYLYGARIIEEKDKAVFAFENDGGEQIRVSMEAVSFKSKPQWLAVSGDEDDLPLYRKNGDKYYSYTYLEDKKTMYVLYNSCRQMKEKPFKDFVVEVFEQVDGNPVDRFVVDLRNNGGGSSIIFYPLLKEVRDRGELNTKDRLYVILGRRTFSSAVLNALQMKNHTNATFVGEPTGGKPNHFGELKSLVLPNSRMQVTYSTKYFSHSKEDTDSIYPDILVELSIHDYLNKKDPVMEKILNR